MAPPLKGEDGSGLKPDNDQMVMVLTTRDTITVQEGRVMRPHIFIPPDGYALFCLL